jgi:hypothetical protein
LLRQSVLVDDLAQYRITRIAIEKLVIRDGTTVADRGKRQTTVVQAKAVGVWEQAISERFPGIKIEHVHPSTWRAWISMPPGDRARGMLGVECGGGGHVLRGLLHEY